MGYSVGGTLAMHLATSANPPPSGARIILPQPLRLGRGQHRPQAVCSLRGQAILRSNARKRGRALEPATERGADLGVPARTARHAPPPATERVDVRQLEEGDLDVLDPAGWRLSRY